MSKGLCGFGLLLNSQHPDLGHVDDVGVVTGEALAHIQHMIQVGSAVRIRMGLFGHVHRIISCNHSPNTTGHTFEMRKQSQYIHPLRSQDGQQYIRYGPSLPRTLGVTRKSLMFAQFAALCSL